MNWITLADDGDQLKAYGPFTHEQAGERAEKLIQEENVLTTFIMNLETDEAAV